MLTCDTSVPSCVVSLLCSCLSERAAVLKLDASVVACWISTDRVAGSPGLLATESNDDQKFDELRGDAVVARLAEHVLELRASSRSSGRGSRAFRAAGRPGSP